MDDISAVATWDRWLTNADDAFRDDRAPAFSWARWADYVRRHHQGPFAVVEGHIVDATNQRICLFMDKGELERLNAPPESPREKA